MLSYYLNAINSVIISLFETIIIKNQVEENVAAAVELSIAGKDKETLSEVEAILKPVKNQTWPSGIQQSWQFFLL